MGRFNWRRWSVRAGVRAVKTAAETAGAMVGTEMVGITDVDWPGVASVSA
ncbi:MAG: holin, partial [Actinomycetota bacterium]